MKAPSQRTPLWWASTGVSGDSRQRRSPGARQRTTARSTSWPSRKMSADTCTVSADGALDWPAPQSTVGAGCCDPDAAQAIWPWRGRARPPLFPTCDFHEPAACNCISPRCRAGSLAHPRYRVRRLARGGGPVVVAGAAARARPIGRARRTRRRRLSPRGAGSWPIPTRRCRRPSARTFRARHGFWIDDWAAFAGGTRAINDQVRFEREWSALRAYAARARRAADRRRADLRRARQRRPRRATPSSSATTSWPASRPTPSPPRASCGATRSTTGRALRRRRYRWWVERLRRTFELFDLARIDHFRGFAAYWAVPRGARDAAGGRWARGPRRAPCSTRRAPSSGACRSSPRTSASSRPRSRGCATRWACRAWSCCSSASTPHERESAHRPERYRAGQVLYTARTTTTRCAAGTSRCRPSAWRAGARGGRGRARAVVGAHGARAVVEGAAVHAPGPGRRSGWAPRRG